MKPIPYGKHEITEEDIQAVEEVLRSDFLTQGPKVQEFEDAFANYVGSDYAVAVANGTAALHLSAMALYVKPGQKVITTPITFAASANCVRYCGGDVIFCDIDPETYLLDINKVRETLEQRKDEDIVGIIPVDFTGYPVDMEAFWELADEYGLWLLEDACHAPGGYFMDSKGQKQYCGNGNFADLAIFSFHPVKHIAAGEGGMITTNNKQLHDRLKNLRTHGIHKNQEQFTNPPDLANGQPTTTNNKQQTTNNEPRTTNQYPGWYYEMQELGYNYRMTDLQAALGLSQLQRAEENLEKRKAIAKKYDEAFKDIPGIIPAPKPQPSGHAYHLYVIQTEERKDLFDHLRAHNILVQVHYIPVHLMPYYQKLGWDKDILPMAECYYNYCLSLPLFPSLEEEEYNRILNLIKSCVDD